MIPLKDINPTRKFPIVTISIIGMNIFIFLYQISLGFYEETFFSNFGLVPSKLIYQYHTNPLILLTLFTSIFIHGGIFHLIGNMLYLWIFGDNVEDKFGHLRFLIFYFFCGVSASILHIMMYPNSNVPTVGASGAISGVLGAYMIMFPKARVITLIPIFIFIEIAEIPALILLGLWFVLQFFSGLISLGFESDNMGGIAWWAHIGGFVVGLLSVKFFRKYR